MIDMKKLVLASILATVSGMVFAGPCDVNITGNDMMQFSLKTIEVPKTCKTFTVNLSHIGKQPKAAMGHNWVLTQTKDVNAVAADGIKAGLASDYIKKGDARVIAHTKLIGGGEKTSVTFNVSKLSAANKYTFLCVFPGHSAVMKGTLTLK